MTGKFDKGLEDFFSSDAGKKLAGRKDDLERLASGADGQQVSRMLQGRDLSEALEKGDTETLKGALSDIMSTDAGARLISKLSDLMGK